MPTPTAHTSETVTSTALNSTALRSIGLTPTLATKARRGPARVLLALGLGMTLAFAPMSEAYARGTPESFADLAADISPSVVNITTSAVIAAPTGGGPIVPEGSPFQDFFKDFMPP